MILTHWTPEPFTFDSTRTYNQRTDRLKPVGLWLSDESDHGWSSWCRDEDWNVDGLAHSTEFEVVGGDVLHISTASELRAFGERYGNTLHPGGSSIWIDWDRVAADHGGIIISPYQWSCRLGIETMWYYSWDVASACIWDLSVLRPVTAIVS